MQTATDKSHLGILILGICSLVTKISLDLPLPFKFRESVAAMAKCRTEPTTSSWLRMYELSHCPATDFHFRTLSEDVKSGGVIYMARRVCHSARHLRDKQIRIVVGFFDWYSVLRKVDRRRKYLAAWTLNLDISPRSCRGRSNCLSPSDLPSPLSPFGLAGALNRFGLD